MSAERPYDARPPAKPIPGQGVMGGAPEGAAAPSSKKKGGWGGIIALFAVVAVVWGIVAIMNQNKEATPDAASPDCDAAFASASAAMNQHYATHPLFGAEYDAIYADGAVSDEERVTLDAMLADEEAQFAALVDPVYDACAGVEDLYSGAFAHRDDADWALLDIESMSREDIKSDFIFSYCYENESRPACSDFVLDDWNRQL